MNSKYKWWILGGVSILILGTLTTIYFVRKKKSGKKSSNGDEKNDNNNKKSTDYTKNIIIGDSQTPFIAKNTTKAIILNKVGSEEALWKGGQNLKWLKGAVEKYKKSPEINAIIINIGTNGGFNVKEDVVGLVNSIKSTFPNADLYAVQGSWGWGGNKNKTLEMVTNYYNKFKDVGVKLIEPPIGSVKDPHGNLPVYAQIGKSIDNEL
jgi:hypothetical protein